MSARKSLARALFAACLTAALTASVAVPASTGLTALTVPGARAAQRDWATCSAGVTTPARTWYLAEGCTEGGFETWVLVQNPGSGPADVEMTLQTDKGAVPGPRDTVPAASRRTYDLSAYVSSWNVSTFISADSDIVVERAMYGNGREWGTGAAGVNAPSETWYLAEGCTEGGLETWVLVQNPGGEPAQVTMTLNTGSGSVPGPRDTVPAFSRRSYNLADYAVSWDVSTVVSAGAPVVVERAMYGNGREWGTDASAAPAPRTRWYMAEGCTGDDFETWLLVQNPSRDRAADIGVRLLTGTGEVTGPAGSVPPGCRKSYNLADYVHSPEVSMVVDSSIPVVCERAMYGSDRLWGTCSNGCPSLSGTWFLAEGCTANGFETWLLLQNPGAEPVDISVELQTENGPVAGPSATIGPRKRATFDLGEFVASYNVSAKVTASGPVACERSMYGEGTSRRMCVPVDGPLLYPFSKDESIACGQWPAGSTDYPYFGAPRDGGRLHAGIDIYPAAGRGAPVRAMKAGTVVKTGLFYTRYTGEQTFAVLVDHHDFTANYAELEPLAPWVKPGAALAKGQVFGTVSGTVQLHFETYAPGTASWIWWYGPQPANLIDPAPMALGLYY